MCYQSIYSLGSRCQNSLILKKNNLREFSGFFDFLNVEQADTLIHILKDEFYEFLKIENIVTFDFNRLTIDPETDENLLSSVRTSNKFYQPNDYSEPDLCICPHYDLKRIEHREHFFRCIDRFKKLNAYKVLFNYTFNSWENNLEKKHFDEITYILKTKYRMCDFRVCFISLNKSNKSIYKLTHTEEFYDVWDLNILTSSYSGGLFNNEIDNENFINIINHYPLCDKRVTKKDIDQIEI